MWVPETAGRAAPNQVPHLGLRLSRAWLLPSSCLHQDMREKELGEGSYCY